MLRQNEQHVQIEIMANNGLLCIGIENDKGNIFESELWKKIKYNGTFLKSFSMIRLVIINSMRN